MDGKSAGGKEWEHGVMKGHFSYLCHRAKQTTPKLRDSFFSLLWIDWAVLLVSCPAVRWWRWLEFSGGSSRTLGWWAFLPPCFLRASPLHAASPCGTPCGLSSTVVGVLTCSLGVPQAHTWFFLSVWPRTSTASVLLQFPGWNESQAQPRFHMDRDYTDVDT